MAATGNRTRAFNVMVKPNGPWCNLACTYCYYLEKERIYPETRKYRMADHVLEAFIRQYAASQAGIDAPEIWFNWQGGEPTALGIDFFRRVVELQEAHRPAGRTIRNALQTNGTLVDAEWAKFLHDNDFLVGLSLDGPRELHDRYRVDRRHGPTFDKVMAAVDLLKRHAVEFNTLTVVNRRNSQAPREVYRFLRELGVRFMQFIPIVERSAGDGLLAGAPQSDPDGAEHPVTPWSVLPNAYGDFLCAVFDDWVRRDVGRVFVQLFEVQLGLWAGGPGGLCWFAERCGDGLVLEHNGDVYACDHYVYPEFRRGNIRDVSLAELASSPEQVRFGDAKSEGLPRLCGECTFRAVCNGGCPKHRFLKTPDGEPALNYFCAANRRFFSHAGPYLRRMTELLHAGQSPAHIMEMVGHERKDSSSPGKLGRNAACPCGSGRKFKHCCGNPASGRPDATPEVRAAYPSDWRTGGPSSRPGAADER